jgi:hypothetical protein
MTDKTWYDLLHSHTRLEPVALELSKALSSEDFTCEDISSGLVSPEQLISLMEKKQKLPTLTGAAECVFLACLKQLAGGEQQPRCGALL